MVLQVYCNWMKTVGKDKFFTVRKLVAQEALEKGIKPTARRFGMSRNTVRLWLKRFKTEGNDGLIDRRAGPNHNPHKTSEELEEQIVEIRKTVPCYGAYRLKHFFGLTPSVGALSELFMIEDLLAK